jgi:hypothetical protein
MCCVLFNHDLVRPIPFKPVLFKPVAFQPVPFKPLTVRRLMTGPGQAGCLGQRWNRRPGWA